MGGAPYYSARALRLIGRPARIVTKVAEADRRLLRPLAALGVPVTWRAASETTGFTISYDGDTRAMAVDALGEAWTAEDLRGWAGRALDGVEWVHAAPLLRSDFPAETLRVLARGRKVALDGQGLVRRPAAGPLRLDADFDPAMLEHLTVLKLAEEEATTLGAVDEAGLAALGVPEIVLTLGARGSLVWYGGRLEEVVAPPVPGRIDPTGAGDAFAAGYVAARSVGHGPVAAARSASLVVSALLTGRR